MNKGVYMKKVIFFLTILAFCFISCEGLDDDDDGKGKSVKTSVKKVKDIKYTVKSDNKTHTNSLEFTFADEIMGLKAKDIHIKNKSGSVKKGKLSGSGASWSLEVFTSVPGRIEVKIKKSGIEDKKKKVTVYHWLYIDLPEEWDCDKCEEEQDYCDDCEENDSGECDEQDCDECIEYNCYNCKDQGCDACIEYDCYNCKDQGCDACIEYNCYNCKDQGCDACRV